MFVNTKTKQKNQRADVHFIKKLQQMANKHIK